MTDMFPDLPDWSFEADEVSAGVYRAFGRDRAGRSVEAIGLDPDELIEKCKQKALQLIDEIQPAGDSA
jgi:hypothetical protein